MALVERQHGVVTLRQLTALGLGRGGGPKPRRPGGCSGCTAACMWSGGGSSGRAGAGWPRCSHADRTPSSRTAPPRTARAARSDRPARRDRAPGDHAGHPTCTRASPSAPRTSPWSTASRARRSPARSSISATSNRSAASSGPSTRPRCCGSSTWRGRARRCARRTAPRRGRLRAVLATCTRPTLTRQRARGALPGRSAGAGLPPSPSVNAWVQTRDGAAYQVDFLARSGTARGRNRRVAPSTRRRAFEHDRRRDQRLTLAGYSRSALHLAPGRRGAGPCAVL